MRNKIIGLVFGIFILGLANNAFAEEFSMVPAQFDDNFDSYVSDSTMLNYWNNGPWWAGWYNSQNNFDPDTSEMRVTVSLSQTEGFQGSQAMQIYTETDSGVVPVSFGGLGAAWVPCSYFIMGTGRSTNDRTDLTNYSGIRVWIKPGTITGDQDMVFKMNMIESSTRGGEKWMHSGVYVTSLAAEGQYVYFDFADFTEYKTGSGEPMDRSSISTSFMFFTYEYEVEEKSTATIWIDNYYAVPIDIAEDFESYATDTEMQTAWTWTGVENGEGAITTALNQTGGFDGTRAMQLDFSFPSGDVDSWGYSGGPFDRDWSAYNGVSLWLKATETGDPQVIQLKIGEGDGDKFHSADVLISDLDLDGEYVYLDFDDFVNYVDGGDGVLDVSDVTNLIVFAKHHGTATQASSVSILVDDITPSQALLEPNVVEDFEVSYNVYGIGFPWVAEVVGDSANSSISASGGANGSQGFQIDTYFSYGGADTVINAWFYAGEPVRPAVRNWSQYDSIKVWLNASETGSLPHSIEMAIHEGDSTTSWGDKMNSASVLISDLPAGGGYVMFAFDEFVRYGGYGGPKDNDVFDRSDIRSVFVFVKYYGTAAAEETGYTSSASIIVDNITLVKGSTVAIDQDLASLPGEFTLHQNYPNPFNPVTTIQFDMTRTSDVKLVIYNILGQEVISLVNDRMDAGSHTVLWNGRDQLGNQVATGMYIYRMSTKEFSTAKKLILMK